MAMLLASLGGAATVVMALMPLLQTDNLSRRIKAVSTERERIRLRERERLARPAAEQDQLRLNPGGLAKNIADLLNLANWLSTDTAKQQLAQAGFRGEGAENAFLGFRFVAPIVFFLSR